MILLLNDGPMPKIGDMIIRYFENSSYQTGFVTIVGGSVGVDFGNGTEINKSSDILYGYTPEHGRHFLKVT